MTDKSCYLNKQTLLHTIGARSNGELISERKHLVQPGTMNRTNILLGAPNTNDLQKKHSDALSALINASYIKQFKTGDHISRGDKPQNRISYLLSGSAQRCKIDDFGHELIYCYLTEGSLIGIEGLCSDAAAKDIWITAKTDCTIAEVPYNTFKALKNTHECLMTMVLSQAVANNHIVECRMHDTVHMTIPGRIRKILCSLIHDNTSIVHEDHYEVNITRFELSSVIGCSREMVGRVLKELQNDGFLKMHGNKRKITVYKDQITE